MVKATINDKKDIIFSELVETSTKLEALIVTVSEKNSFIENLKGHIETNNKLLEEANIKIAELVAAGTGSKTSVLSVVIGYNKAKHSPEALLTTLRSIDHNLRIEDYQLVVIGDCEDWFSENILHIAHESRSSNAGLDLIHKIQVACESTQVSDSFVVVPVGTYLISPVLLGDIEIVKVEKPRFATSADKQAYDNTCQLLSEANCPVAADLTYSCKLPVVYDKEKFVKLFVEFPDIDTMIVDIDLLYFRYYFGGYSAVKLNHTIDNVKLNVINENPNETAFNQYVEGKKFLVPYVDGPLVKNYLTTHFGQKSAFFEK
jgi:hypothetical protein